MMSGVRIFQIIKVEMVLCVENSRFDSSLFSLAFHAVLPRTCSAFDIYGNNIRVYNGI